MGLVNESSLPAVGEHACMVCTDTSAPILPGGQGYVCQKCLHLAAQLWPNETATADKMRSLRDIVHDLGAGKARPLLIMRPN